MNESIVINIVAPIVSAVVGWLVGRRKVKAEAEGSELTNVQSALGIYNEMLKDLKARMDELSLKCDSLAAENEKLRGDLLIAHQDNDRLKARVASLEAQLKNIQS